MRALWPTGDHFQAETPGSTFIEEATYFEAPKIQNGASVLLPRNWLSDSAYVNAFNAFGETVGSMRSLMSACGGDFPTQRPQYKKA
jgi:hypothetical protein